MLTTTQQANKKKKLSTTLKKKEEKRKRKGGKEEMLLVQRQEVETHRKENGIKSEVCRYDDRRKGWLGAWVGLEGACGARHPKPCLVRQAAWWTAAQGDACPHRQPHNVALATSPCQIAYQRNQMTERRGQWEKGNKQGEKHMGKGAWLTVIFFFFKGGIDVCVLFSVL